MKNVLSLYYHDQPRTAERMNRLIDEIEEVILRHMTADQIDYFENEMGKETLITLDVLEHALGKGAEHISGMRNGRMPISKTTMRALDLLHTAVHRDPERAVRAIDDFIERQKMSSHEKDT